MDVMERLVVLNVRNNVDVGVMWMEDLRNMK